MWWIGPKKTSFRDPATCVHQGFKVDLPALDRRLRANARLRRTVGPEKLWRARVAQSPSIDVGGAERSDLHAEGLAIMRVALRLGMQSHSHIAPVKGAGHLQVDRVEPVLLKGASAN
jgi:hypothetical protein